MQRDFKFRERLREDVRGHSLCGAVFDVDLPVRYGLANEVETYVNMFCASVIVVVCCEVKRGLIVTVEGGWSGVGSE